MKPPKSILDPTFEWIPPAKTDTLKRFRKIWREQRTNATEAAQVVRPIKRKEAK